MVKFNLGNALSGGVAGSALGGPAGGALGALGMGFFGGGSQAKTKKLPTMNTQQEQVLNQLLQSLGGGQLGGLQGGALGQLGEYLDPSSASYQRFADPYMRQFEQQTVPQLAERFAGAGAMGGALSSSGFGQALGAAGANLQSELASMKTGLQRQAIGDILNQYQSRLGLGLGARPFGYQQINAEPGFGGAYAAGGFPGASQGMGNLSNWLQDLLVNYLPGGV